MLYAHKVIVFILTLKKTAFQRQNFIILSTKKQRQNLMLKQRLFWVGTKTNFILVKTMDSTRRINVILMCFVVPFVISMGE